MIYFKKTQPAPKSLLKEKNKKNGNPSQDDVVEQLHKDFYHKCYICEYSGHSLCVEHFVPHRNDPDLKFDWNNLFLACTHCNNIKGTKYLDILNCTDINDSVDTKIAYKCNLFPTSNARFRALDEGEKTKNTVRLLQDVFDGTTVAKKKECINLNKALAKEMRDFNNLIWDYYESVHDEDRLRVLAKIKSHLHKGANFSAFKRYAIRREEVTREDFEKYIQDED